MGKYALLAIAAYIVFAPLQGASAGSEDKATTRSASSGLPSSYGGGKPVSDKVFKSYLPAFAYDPTALNAVVEHVPDDSEIWTREKVSFDAAYGGERVPAHLFLPKGVRSPYQAAVYCPRGTALEVYKSFDEYWESNRKWQTTLLDVFIREGRALMIPVYTLTFERGPSKPLTSVRKEDGEKRGVKMIKDLCRAVGLGSQPWIDRRGEL